MAAVRDNSALHESDLDPRETSDLVLQRRETPAFAGVTIGKRRALMEKLLRDALQLDVGAGSSDTSHQSTKALRSMIKPVYAWL